MANSLILFEMDLILFFYLIFHVIDIFVKKNFTKNLDVKHNITRQNARFKCQCQVRLQNGGQMRVGVSLLFFLSIVFIALSVRPKVVAAK